MNLDELNARAATAEPAEVRHVLTSLKCARGEMLAQARYVGAFFVPHKYYEEAAAAFTAAIATWEARLQQLQPGEPTVKYLGNEFLKGRI